MPHGKGGSRTAPTEFANIIAWAKKILSLQIALSYLLLIFSTSAGAATLKFEYDQAGNMISGQGRYYEYNDANQLVKVRKDAPSGPVIAEYVYDYQGQRVKKIENGITTYYIGKHYEKRKGNTVNEKTNYIFVNGQRVAASIKKDNEPAKVSYYLNNHLGSADVVVDAQGNVTDKVRYYPYGEYRTQPNAQRHTYTGKERDEATEQYYYEARYYNPFIRRFAQADTVTPKLYDPQSLNRYTYALNNPLRYIDPTGHASCQCTLEKYVCDDGTYAVPYNKFVDYARGKTAWKLRTDGNRIGSIQDRLFSAGPAKEYKFVYDPKTGKRIDMRHFLVLGQYDGSFSNILNAPTSGTSYIFNISTYIIPALKTTKIAGDLNIPAIFPDLTVETFQGVAGASSIVYPTEFAKGNRDSAFSKVDMFSNSLGREFYRNFDLSKSMADNIEIFFEDRSK